jgi:hypothetical protein
MSKALRGDAIAGPVWHRLGRGLRLAGLAGIVVALMMPAPALAAYRNLFAHFRATLKGTYTSSEETTYTDCSSPPGTPPPTKSGTVTDRVEFASVRPQAVEVALLALPPLAAGGTGADMKIRVSDDRESTLTSEAVPPNCLPHFETPATCGTKSAEFDGDVQAAVRGIGLGFVFRQNRTITTPADFLAETCQLPQPAYWFGAQPFLTGPTTVHELFDPHRHTVVIQAKRSGRKTEGGSGSTSTANFSERYTLTLVRTSAHG